MSNLLLSENEVLLTLSATRQVPRTRKTFLQSLASFASLAVKGFPSVTACEPQS